MRYIKNSPALLLLLLWIGLFLYRKSFSYISIGPIYIIEFIIIITTFLFLFLRISFLKEKAFLFIGLRRFIGLILTITLLCLFLILRIFFTPSVTSISLIPILYCFYFLLFLFVFDLASLSFLKNILEIQYIFFALPPIAYIIITLTSSVVGIPELPGQTFILGVSLAIPLTWNNRLFSIIGILISGIFTLLLMERAVFLNAGLGILILVIINSDRSFVERVFRYFRRLLLAIILVISFGPLLFNIFFQDQFTRFDLSSYNLVQFLLSIFDSSISLGDTSGTRSHRLEMWRDIIRSVFDSPGTAIFGYGFEGNVLDILGVKFRAPHNGFVTILYRMGLIGLVLYISFLNGIFKHVKTSVNYLPSKYKSLVAIIFGSFLGDTLTGTMIDSPFTYTIVLISISSIFIFQTKRIQYEKMVNCS